MSGVGPADRLAARTVQVADSGGLWWGLAALLGASGNRFGRRAALRALLASGVASGLVNGTARLIARRPPTSTFPSAGAATAFAFATGVAQELPVAGVPVAALAGLVGWSRARTGVHRPAGVVGGAALGVAAGLATRRLWPVAPHEAAEARAVLTPAHVDPSPEGEGLVVVVNASAGSADKVADELRAELPHAEIVEVDAGAGDDLLAALEQAADRARALGVAGGDGTVNAAAEVAAARELPLLVVPGGTLNHFAHALGVDTIADAAAAVRDGRVVAVDRAELGGRTFLNTGSIGSYTDLVDAREKLEDRIGKWPAMVVALVHVLRHSEPVPIELDGDPDVGVDGVHRQLPVPPRRLRPQLAGAARRRDPRHPHRPRPPVVEGAPAGRRPHRHPRPVPGVRAALRPPHGGQVAGRAVAAGPRRRDLRRSRRAPHRQDRAPAGVRAGPVTLRESLLRRLDPAERYGLRVTLLAIAFALVAVPFAFLVSQVNRQGLVHDLDMDVLHGLHTWVTGSPGVVRPLRVVSDLGVGVWRWAITVAAVVVLLRAGRGRLAIFLVVTALVGVLLDFTVKLAVDRPRPELAHPIATVRLPSFPSGHVLSSTVVYGSLLLVFLPAVARRWRPWLVAGGAGLVAAIAFSRLALGVHYLSDVVAGLVLGLAWLAISTAAFSIWRVERGRPPVHPMEGLEPEAAADLREIPR